MQPQRKCHFLLCRKAHTHTHISPESAEKETRHWTHKKCERENHCPAHLINRKHLKHTRSARERIQHSSINTIRSSKFYFFFFLHLLVFFSAFLPLLLLLLFIPIEIFYDFFNGGCRCFSNFVHTRTRDGRTTYNRS